LRWRVARDVDVYGCMSQFALSMLERWCGRRGVLIPGGVRLESFVPAAHRAEKPAILFSGALDVPRKRADLLLEAVALLADDMDVEVWLSGPGDGDALISSAPPAARARAVALPLGSPEAQAERYGRAWVTALPSTYDSFGLVLIESLACGTPIVVANHAAPPELVEPGIGAVCEPDDPASLARALRTALDLARDPACAARCREVAARFDWDDQIAPLLENLYTERLLPSRYVAS
jgi:glycosyltransferase involved in cell wall biosynthesis